MEHWTDPMPGVCARCMDVRLVAVAEALTRDVEAGAAPHLVMRNHFRRLVEAGVLPAAAAQDVRRFAEAFGYPVPKEALAAADVRWERATQEYLTTDADGRPA